ncbi:hypothetical protein BJ138DRAFT_1104551 [Hygrophoropsis aurantiaca]|uniref:Uncharacterized protein n=1 Tax=Hygrophoropsis aurantiaca TaxID=72124 RepID=A0ACB8A1D1_9AGAM|nr:hypothetical protein BJ138DRAFT_1104551 [Hygrophoropsis aurantiaca]
MTITQHKHWHDLAVKFGDWPLSFVSFHTGKCCPHYTMALGRRRSCAHNGCDCEQFFTTNPDGTPRYDTASSASVCTGCNHPWIAHLCLEATDLSISVANQLFSRGGTRDGMCGGFFSDDERWTVSSACVCSRKWSAHQMLAPNGQNEQPYIQASVGAAAATTIPIPSAVNASASLARQPPISPYRGLPASTPGTTVDRCRASALRTLPQHQNTPRTVAPRSTNAGRTRPSAPGTTSIRRSGVPRPFPSSSSSNGAVGSSLLLSQFSNSARETTSPSSTKFILGLLPYVLPESQHGNVNDPSPAYHWTNENLFDVCQRLQKSNLIIEVTIPDDVLVSLSERFDSAITQHCTTFSIELPSMPSSNATQSQHRSPTVLTWHLLGPKGGRGKDRKRTWVMDPKSLTAFTFTVEELRKAPYGTATPNHLPVTVISEGPLPRFLTNKIDSIFTNLHTNAFLNVSYTLCSAFNTIFKLPSVPNAHLAIQFMMRFVDDEIMSVDSDASDPLLSELNSTFPSFGEMLAANQAPLPAGQAQSLFLPDSPSHSRSSSTVSIEAPPRNRQRLESPVHVDVHEGPSVLPSTEPPNPQNNSQMLILHPDLAQVLQGTCVTFNMRERTHRQNIIGPPPETHQAWMEWKNNVGDATRTRNSSDALRIVAPDIESGAIALITLVGWMHGKRPRSGPQFKDTLKAQLSGLMQAGVPADVFVTGIHSLAGLFNPRISYKIGDGVGRGPEKDVVSRAMQMLIADDSYWVERAGYRTFRLHGSTEPIAERVGMLKTMGTLLLLHIFVLGVGPNAFSPFAAASIIFEKAWMTKVAGNISILSALVDVPTLSMIKLLIDHPLSAPMPTDTSSHLYQILVESGIDVLTLSRSRTRAEHDGLVHAVISFILLGQLPAAWMHHPDYLALVDGFNVIWKNQDTPNDHKYYALGVGHIAPCIDKIKAIIAQHLQSFEAMNIKYIVHAFNRSPKAPDDVIPFVTFKSHIRSDFHEDNKESLELFKTHVIHYLRGTGHPDHPDVRMVVGEEAFQQNRFNRTMRVEYLLHAMTGSNHVPLEPILFSVKHIWDNTYPILPDNNTTNGDAEIDWGPEVPIKFQSCFGEATVECNTFLSMLLTETAPHDLGPSDDCWFGRWLHMQILPTNLGYNTA